MYVCIVSQVQKLQSCIPVNVIGRFFKYMMSVGLLTSFWVLPSQLLFGRIWSAQFYMSMKVGLVGEYATYNPQRREHFLSSVPLYTILHWIFLLSDFFLISIRWTFVNKTFRKFLRSTHGLGKLWQFWCLETRDRNRSGCLT